MTQHDITTQVATLQAAGWTEDQILRVHSAIDNLRTGRWVVSNVRGLAAVDDAVVQVRHRAEQAKPRTERPATERQVAFIRDLGGSPTDRMTMATASLEIDRLKAAPRRTSWAASSDPGAEALRIGRSHGINGQVWDNA
jgi:hypothetical protein